MHAHPYRTLFFMAALSFAAMYVLMYAMVNSLGNVYGNVNQAYMAGLMTAPMIIIELLLMRGMYGNTKLNMFILGASVMLLIVFWFLIRTQAAISDEQFLRSMIPHHAGAILMCEEAKLQDPGIAALCERIIAGQQAEIEWMRAKLEARDAE